MRVETGAAILMFLVVMLAGVVLTLLIGWAGFPVVMLGMGMAVGAIGMLLQDYRKIK